MVADRYGITREEQDAFALESQRRAARAQADGAFADEIVPVPLPERRPRSRWTNIPVPTSHARSSVPLRPAFRPDGTVTAGKLERHQRWRGGPARHGRPRDRPTPLARIVTTAVAGVDPACMGLGPVPATRKALARAGLTIDEIDLVELNEAFAAQAIACIRDLALDPAKVNIYGGAIALGHPLGCSGAKILATLVHALRRTGGRLGLATMCIGVGQGIAMIVERT